MRVLDEDKPNACTNEPSGEDLCVRSVAGCDKVPLKCIVDDDWVILRTGYICLWSGGVVARCLCNSLTFRLLVCASVCRLTLECIPRFLTPSSICGGTAVGSCQ